MKRLVMLTVLAAGAGLLPGAALANDRDLRATPIPATSMVVSAILRMTTATENGKIHVF